MKVGVPKETKIEEYRVGLVPGSVRELVERGHEVAIETNAGIGLHALDDDYRAAGASIAGLPRRFIRMGGHDHKD